VKKIKRYEKKIEMMGSGKYVVPVTCELDLSNRCQLNCGFCFYKKKRVNGEELRFGFISSLLEEFERIGVKSVTLTGGGEPLMYDRINEVVRIANARGIELGLVTNGVALDRLDNPNIFKFIRVSLDASRPNLYSMVKGRDYFHKVIYNIHQCLEKGAYLGLSYVVYGMNEDDIESAIRLAELIGVEYIQFKPAWINGRNHVISSKAVKILKENGHSIYTNRLIERDQKACTVAGLVGIVCADGGVYYCCQHRGVKGFKLGSIYTGTFQDAWKRRGEIEVDVNHCPHCRYMNYVADLREESFNGDTKIDSKRHIHFL